MLFIFLDFDKIPVDSNCNSGKIFHFQWSVRNILQNIGRFVHTYLSNNESLKHNFQIELIFSNLFETKCHKNPFCCYRSLCIWATVSTHLIYTNHLNRLTPTGTTLKLKLFNICNFGPHKYSWLNDCYTRFTCICAVVYHLRAYLLCRASTTTWRIILFISTDAIYLECCQTQRGTVFIYASEGEKCCRL